MTLQQLLNENDRRLQAAAAPFDPITGQGSLGQRAPLDLPDFAIPRQLLPKEMFAIPLIKKLRRARSIAAYLAGAPDDAPATTADVADLLIRLRCRYDFPFWAATMAKIKNKAGGPDITLVLNRPQRLLISRFEQARRDGKPIRLILLKARQWGGSTATQLYMAWLQFLHRQGLNSLIVAHQGSASDTIKDMFDTLISQYPDAMLHPYGRPAPHGQPKTQAVGRSGSTTRVPARNCKITIGTAERPDGVRGGSYALVHLSEVGLWRKTDGKSPEDIVRSACSGVLLRPLTMIVMESTPNGVGNFFHREYTAAADPATPSQFQALFIPWHIIDQYSLPFPGPADRAAFAQSLLDLATQDDAPTPRQEPGRYLWWLWQQGATLEAINWYVHERAGRSDHAVMASEFPSDDIEAFVNSGNAVFDRYLVNALAATCRPPSLLGELSAPDPEGPGALAPLTFAPDPTGRLAIWSQPEADPDTVVADRYLAVVDVGGRSSAADYSVILVIDRIGLMYGDPPAVVAQWYGHTDIDRLAWKAAQVAAYYDNALLVIESNTIETRDPDRAVEGGDQSQYILSQIAAVYPNLYARRQSEDEIRQGLPRRYGFHTNVATKPMVISTLVRAIRERLYVERDRRALDEYLTYERRPNGSYGAIPGRHDDLLMARAIGLHVCLHEMEVPARRPRRMTLPPPHLPVSEAVW